MKGALFTICLHLALISKLYHGCDVLFLPAILHESYESCEEWNQAKKLCIMI